MLSILKLPFPAIGKSAKDYELPECLYLGQWIVPKGTVVKLRQSENFGWVVLPENCQDVGGHVIPKRIFKY